MKDSTRTLLMVAGVAAVAYALMRSGSAAAGTVPLASSAPASSAAPASSPASAFDKVLEGLAGAWTSVTTPAPAAPLTSAPAGSVPDAPLPVTVTTVVDAPRVQAAVATTAPADDEAPRPRLPWQRESWGDD